LGKLQQAVRQGAFAVVDVGDNTEIANILHVKENEWMNE
jgi:hypothetical protein